MKNAARKIVENILWSQVKRLRKKNDFLVIAVAGSTGKTSTKMSVAQMLQAKYKVVYQEGNYNVPVSVPLVFFGQKLPSLFNPIAWTGLFIKNELMMRAKYSFDIIVIELGTDQPGELKNFIPRLLADIGLLTSIAPEHMEFFKSIEAVAKEELVIAKLSEKLIYNKDLCDAKYMNAVEGKTYGIKQPADVQLKNLKIDNGYYAAEIEVGGQTFMSIKNTAISKQQLYSFAAAISVGIELGMTAEEISIGLGRVSPVSGRMQKLSGIKDSVIIDDSYNASPDATISALETIYDLEAPYKIAVLGNMNELGEFSEEAHTQVGSYCNPKKLNLVITIGPDANKYLAAAAEKAGCNVLKFDNPYSAGEYLRLHVKQNSLILFKGSQNKVYAEEAIKSVLSNPDDSSKLVRQSGYWLKRKKNNFGVK